MPFSALFALIAILAITAIFVVSLKKWGIKAALYLSALGLLAFSAIFFVFLTIALNNM